MAKPKVGNLKITLTGDWNKFRALVAAFEGNLKKASSRAVKKSVQYALAEIDQRIRDKKYEKLAAITILDKLSQGYSRTPLIRSGGLIRAINTEVVNEFVGYVGILKNAKTSRRGRDKKGRFSKEELANIAETLHEGTTIHITPEMKRAFMRKFGHKLRTRGSGKSNIRIPPRRFIQDVFEDPKFQRKIEQIFSEELFRVVGF